MKKALLLFALLISGAITANEFPDPTTDAKDGSITGKVIDNVAGQPVAYAAVVVRTAEGIQNLAGGITKEDGSFEIKGLPEGDLVLEIQYIGFKTHSQKISISKRNKKMDVGTITIAEYTEELAGVEVVGERTTIEQKIDRKVINVGKDLTTAGATAAEIMNNIPSVNMDQQSGELSLRGNANVRVMVDGKLSNVPVAQLLRQIPSSSIKSIELITNPSAKYNPEGMSGIINIVLHKNANIGFNGNINTGLTLAQEAKFNSSLDLNYRNGKFNFYSNTGVNIGKYVNDGTIRRTIENSEQQFDFLNDNKSYLYKIGVDFFLNDKNTLSFFTNQNIYDGSFNGITHILYYDNPIFNSVQDFNNINDNRSQQYNFDYKVDFKKEGHNLELEVDYNRFKDDEDANFETMGQNVFPNYQDFVDTQRDQTIVNLDYVNPLDSISKLELGLEARLFETDVDYSSTGVSYNGNGNLVPTPDTGFIYGMDIYSAYATFGQNRSKWSYQLGLRVEDVSVTADTNGERTYTDNYTELYPSSFLTYMPSEKNQFQLSYSRRVDRPGLSQVNPIREWSSPLISSLGNEALSPQFTNSFEFNYTRRLKKGSITSGIFYRVIKDDISRALYIDRLDLDKTILTYDNYDDTSSYGVEISGNYRPTKWWSINGSFDLFSQTQQGITESLAGNSATATVDDITVETVEVDNVSWNMRMNNSFNLSKDFTIQVFGFYRGRNQNIQFTMKPMYFVNTGARYNFAKGKATLSLNFNDVFNTMRAAFSSDYPYAQTGRFNWESQSVYAGLSYRFGSGKNRASQRKRRDNNTKQGGGGIL